LCIVGPAYLSSIYGPWIAVGFFTFLAVVTKVAYSGISQRGYEFFGFIEVVSIGLQIFMSVPLELNDSGLLGYYYVVLMVHVGLFGFQSVKSFNLRLLWGTRHLTESEETGERIPSYAFVSKRCSTELG
jgi:hypothetical protein